MKIHPVGAELFHMEGQTDIHEANSHIFAILSTWLKNIHILSSNSVIGPTILIESLFTYEKNICL
jgi:hypothetical protein